MESQPLVSVIMPCYNMAQFVSGSIESVQFQSYKNWELLIVDDASTDNSVGIVKSYYAQDERIHLFVKNIHSGIADSRNQAIRMAQGHFLAFLDADDIWHPEKIECQLHFMTEKHVGFSYSTYDWIDENGQTLNKVIKTVGNMTYKDYLRNTVIGCSTVMVDTEIVGEVVVPKFRTSEDTATWLNILKQGFVAYAIETPLVSYRIRRKSASSNKFKAARDLWSVYRKQEKLSTIQASGYFCSYAYNALKRHLS